MSFILDQFYELGHAVFFGGGPSEVDQADSETAVFYICCAGHKNMRIRSDGLFNGQKTRNENPVSYEQVVSRNCSVLDLPSLEEVSENVSIIGDGANHEDRGSSSGNFTVWRLVCISDTHEKHHMVLRNSSTKIHCHALLHCGDLLLINRHFSSERSRQKLRSIGSWLCGENSPFVADNVVVIAGNHDAICEEIGREATETILNEARILAAEKKQDDPDRSNELFSSKKMEKNGASHIIGEDGNHVNKLSQIHYLENQLIELHQEIAAIDKDGASKKVRPLRIFGSPLSQGSSANDAFQKVHTIREFNAEYQEMQRSGACDIFMTHGPMPENIVQESGASVVLNGHIHKDYGLKINTFNTENDAGSVHISTVRPFAKINCSSLDGAYRPNHAPIVLDLVMPDDETDN